MKEHLVTLDSAEQAWLLATGAGIIERHARLIRERFEQIAQEGRHWPAPWNVPYLLADLEHRIQPAPAQTRTATCRLRGVTSLGGIRGEANG